MNDYSITNRASVFHSLRTYISIAAFAFFICFAAQGISAQGVASYAFAPTSGTFTPLAGATVITTFASGDADDGRYAAAPIGFTFKYDGTNYTQAYAVTNGWMSFITTTNFQFNNSLDGTTNANRPFVAPLFDDLDMTSGSVSYLTTGASPNRIFTMQYLNAKWDYLAAAPGISFQIKLYETTNRVQFIYRQEAGAAGGSPTFGASIGLAGTAIGSGNFLSLNNSSATPTASSTTDTKTISTKPATGQIYTFTPAAAPTAGSVSLSGRAMTSTGRGIRNVLIRLTDGEGHIRVARTTAFGYYRFNDVSAGETVVITAKGKRFEFAQPTQVLNIGEETTDVNFIAAPQ